MGSKRVIYWFRTDLRLHDSPALKAALDLEPDVLWPIFTWDPHYVYRARGGLNRWQFLLDCQKDLSESISKLNHKSKLFVLREAPQTLLPKLFKAWSVTHLVFEKDTDTYPKARDEAVVKAAEEAGVEVIVKYGRTLWDSDEIVAQNGGQPTMSISQLESAGKKIGPVPRPIPSPTSLPDPGDMPLDFEHVGPSTKPDFNSESRSKNDTGYMQIAGPKGDFGIETMEELGFPSATTPHRGGETIALKMFDEIIADKKYTATFEKPKTSPAQFEPQATTLLSPYHHFGALSVRLFYWRIQEVLESYGKDASKPPTSLIGQLLFRDMYFGAQAALGQKFHQTFGNDHCRFIPFYLPSVVDTKTGLSTGEYQVDSEEAELWFKRWKNGVTGFPWIDALMRQLRQSGWIHHLGRHSVASFLTRGGCFVQWERGAEVFEEWLLDHEPACNIGNWQWLACTAFFSQYFRIYSPVSFGQKWDKKGDLIRRFVPELKNLDAKYIYEPWKAPIQDQKKAGVRVVGDGLNKTDAVIEAEKSGLNTYPKRMFDFAERREFCLAKMREAYKIGLHGNDKAIKDGSWKKLFDSPPGFEDDDQDDDALTGYGEHADEFGEDHNSKLGKRRTTESNITSKKLKTGDEKHL